MDSTQLAQEIINKRDGLAKRRARIEAELDAAEKELNNIWSHLSGMGVPGNSVKDISNAGPHINSLTEKFKSVAEGVLSEINSLEAELTKWKN